MLYQVVVTGLDGCKLTIDLCSNEEAMQKITLEELKDKIKKIPHFLHYKDEDVILIFKNKRLEDDTKRLVDYGIVHLSSIIMFPILNGGDEPDLGHTGDGMGGKEGETRKSKEELTLNL